MAVTARKDLHQQQDRPDQLHAAHAYGSPNVALRATTAIPEVLDSSARARAREKPRVWKQRTPVDQKGQKSVV